MRVTKEVQTVELRHTYTCDFCGLGLEHWHPPNPYDEADVTPRGTEGKDELDCCIVCFLEKVRPAIEALGVVFREETGGVTLAVGAVSP